MADQNIQNLTTTRQIFRLVEKSADHAPFRRLPGWKFDEGFWQSPDRTNSAFKLPLSSDLDFSEIPKSFFKSGIGATGSLELDEINCEDETLSLGWSPGVVRGHYWVHNISDYLHSSDSILSIAGDNTTFLYIPNTDPGTIDPSSIRSFIELDQQPDPTIPISAHYLERDANLSVVKGQTFDQVTKFTGTRHNGAEQDGDEYSYTDQDKDEFKIIKNDDEPYLDIPLILNENYVIQNGVLRISLEESPVNNWRVRFSRSDIFKRELPFSEWNEKYADPDQDLTVGDYSIGYHNGIGEGSGVWLWLNATTFNNYGAISYKPKKPVTLQFNKDVKITFGSETPVEITGNIISADGQTFYLPTFPILDRSIFEDPSIIGNLVLDTESTSVFVDGIEWTRVADLSLVGAMDNQNVFELNPLWGTVRFGNGGNLEFTPTYGARPDGAVTATWTAVPLIRFDTKGTKKIFTDSTEDLDPLRNAMKQGFLVLDNRLLTPWKIELTTSSPATRDPCAPPCP